MDPTNVRPIILPSRLSGVFGNPTQACHPSVVEERMLHQFSSPLSLLGQPREHLSDKSRPFLKKERYLRVSESVLGHRRGICLPQYLA
jgi:hypothetical protein